MCMASLSMHKLSLQLLLKELSERGYMSSMQVVIPSECAGAADSKGVAWVGSSDLRLPG